MAAAGAFVTLLLTGCEDEKKKAADAVNAASHGLVEVCPPDPAGKMLQFVDYVYIGPKAAVGVKNPRDEQRKAVYRLNVIRLSDGQRVHRIDLGAMHYRKQAPSCFGYDGGLVWWLVGDQLELRDAESGKVVKDAAALRAAGIDGSAQIQYDDAAKKLWLRGSDGRMKYVDAKGLSSKPAEGNPSGRTKRRVTGEAWSVPRVHTGLRGELAPAAPTDIGDGKKLQADPKSGRTALSLDGEALGSADYLHPQFLLHPTAQSTIWPDPPSLMLLEAGAMDKKEWGIVRLGLDGKEHAKISPRSGVAKHNVAIPPWQASGDGSKLLHFGDKGLAAFHAKTGKELWSKPY